MKICTVPHVILTAPVTSVLVLLIIIFSAAAFYNKLIFYKTALHPYQLLRKHEYFKVLTADFVHIDLQHFIVNEASLFFVCGELERYLRHASKYGSLEFAAIYFAGLLTGDMVIIWRYRNKPEYSTAGASGSIMGCLFGFMYLEPQKVAIYLPLLGALKNEYYAVIYIALMFMLKKRIASSGANYELHFWGAVGGILMTLLISRLV